MCFCPEGPVGNQLENAGQKDMLIKKREREQNTKTSEQGRSRKTQT